MFYRNFLQLNSFQNHFLFRYMVEFINENTGILGVMRGATRFLRQCPPNNFPNCPGIVLIFADLLIEIFFFRLPQSRFYFLFQFSENLSHTIRQGTQETPGPRKISVLIAWGLAAIIETSLSNLVSRLSQLLPELTNYQTRLPLIGNRNKHN